MIDQYEKLAARLNESQLKRNEVLAPYTTFRIGGPADLFYSTEIADDLAGAICAARDLHVPYFVLGLGANILVGDKGFRGLVIRNHASHFTFSDDGRLWVESGAVMADIIPEAVERGGPESNTTLESPAPSEAQSGKTCISWNRSPNVNGRCSLPTSFTPARCSPKRVKGKPSALST